MYFPCIGTKARGRLNGRFSQLQARGCAIPAIEVNVVVSPGQLAIRLEKRRVTGDSLIQQIGRLEQTRLPGASRAHNSIQKKSFGAAIKIEGSEIGCWWSLNGKFLRSGDFGIKALCDFLRDLALDREHVFQIAIVLFRPDVRIGVGVDQLDVYVKPGAGFA